MGGAGHILLDVGRLVFVFLGDSGLRFLLPVGGDVETFSLESIKVILFEQETVTRTAWKDGILKAEVSHSSHGIGFPSIWIN